MTITPLAPRPSHTEKRPLLGLRRKPGRLALVFMRMPLRAYRHDAGWLLGRVFVEFTHIGRTSGKRYDAVAMVLHHDESSGEVVICAGWGPDTDWYRNLRVHPAAQVRLGRDTFVPIQRFLTVEEAFEVVKQFRAAHPHRVRLITRILGWGDLDDDEGVRDFIRGHPFVAFRPARRPVAT